MISVNKKQLILYGLSAFLTADLERYNFCYQESETDCFDVIDLYQFFDG